jgi:hypothetical protein
LSIVFTIMIATSLISTLSGLWGVLVTDLFQFVLKMSMVIVLAYYAVRTKAVGGMGELKTKLRAMDAAKGSGSILSFTPDLNSAWMPTITFCVYLGVTWWSTWYPSAEPGGGGYVAQRMFSAKDERHSLLATLWFTVANYAIRPWPWILTALGLAHPVSHASGQGVRLCEGHRGPQCVSVRPGRADGRRLCGRLHVHCRDAAQLGASYLVSDFYRRFISPDRSDAHLRPRRPGRDADADAHLIGGDLLPKLDLGRVAVPDGHRRGHRHGAYPPVVLVAHQRLERGRRHGHLIRRVDGAGSSG